jgi:hypothetical protein
MDGSPSPDVRDVETVLAFGEAQPEVFGGLYVDGPRMHVGLTDLSHAGALRAQLVEPALMDVERVAYSQAELQHVQEEISRLVRELPNRLESLGVGYQQVSLNLRADGMEFAHAVSRRFGDRVRVRVGGRPYPPDGLPLPAPKPPQATRTITGLSVTVHPARDYVRSGAGFSGTVRLTNVGDEIITLDTDQPLSGFLLDSNGSVAGKATGWTAGTGLGVGLEPGGSQEITFYGGTAATSGDRYSTAPGEYAVVVVVPVYDGAPGGQILSEPAAIRVR